jgi:hypothetical protein
MSSRASPNWRVSAGDPPEPRDEARASVSARRVLRVVFGAALIALIGTLLAAVSAWIRVIGSPNALRQYLAIWFLAVFLDSYLWVWVIAVLGAAFSAYLVWRSRRIGRGRSEIHQPRQFKALRYLVLCASFICGFLLAELTAAGWLAWLHRLPTLPGRFAKQARQSGEYSIVVIGGSSALGVPYEDWLSVGTIVGRELEQAIPASRFHVEVLAERGATLEDMHRKLARLTRKPDVLIVYSGHNEFLARFTLANQVYYYDDERTIASRWARLEFLSRVSPLLTLVRENLEKQRVRLLPTFSVGVLERIVGRPVCEPAAAAKLFADFRRRLEAIVSDCERIGCLPVLIIPPGNDASDPNRSYASPQTHAALRHALASRMESIRQAQEDNHAWAIAEYRQVISEQPGFASAHHRLARLLEMAGSFSEANDHYILARDHDGLPLRCVSALEAAYRDVAKRHGANVVLVDGPGVLRRRSRHGILDGELFHDAVHPTLAGHVALAGAVLGELKARGALGWPDATPAPALDPKRCGAQFGLDRAAWALVCQRAAAQYEMLSFLTVDPLERMQRRDHWLERAKQIRGGVPLESLVIPGYPGAYAAADCNDGPAMAEESGPSTTRVP